MNVGFRPNFQPVKPLRFGNIDTVQKAADMVSEAFAAKGKLAPYTHHAMDGYEVRAVKGTLGGATNPILVSAVKGDDGNTQKNEMRQILLSLQGMQETEPGRFVFEPASLAPEKFTVFAVLTELL